MNHPRQVAFQLGSLANMMRRLIPTDVKARSMEGLTMRQRMIIGFIGRREPDSVYQKDIEAEMNIRRSTASVLLRQLETAGFIHRTSVEHDARLKQLTLTPKARQRLALAMGEMGRMENLLTEHITQDELDLFYRVTDKMKANLERAIAGRATSDQDS